MAVDQWAPAVLTSGTNQQTFLTGCPNHLRLTAEQCLGVWPGRISILLFTSGLNFVFVFSWRWKAWESWQSGPWEEKQKHRQYGRKKAAFGVLYNSILKDSQFLEGLSETLCDRIVCVCVCVPASHTVSPASQAAVTGTWINKWPGW